MKKALFTLSLFTLLILPVGITQAVDVLDPVCSRADPSNLPAVCKDNEADASDGDNPLYGSEGIITKGVNIFSIVVGVTAVFVLIIAGLKFISSGGDSSQISTARNAVVYAVIGLVISIFAQALVRFVLSKL